MNKLDPLVLIAVFKEMLGAPLLWFLISATVLGTLAFVTLLIKERAIVPTRRAYCQALGLIGASLAWVLMAKLSSSGFADAGGPIDWVVMAFVFALGFVGSSAFFYTAAGWWSSLKK